MLTPELEQEGRRLGLRFVPLVPTQPVQQQLSQSLPPGAGSLAAIVHKNNEPGNLPYKFAICVFRGRAFRWIHSLLATCISVYCTRYRELPLPLSHRFHPQLAATHSLKACAARAMYINVLTVVRDMCAGD